MKKFIGIFIVLFLLVGIVIGIYLVKRQQNLKSKAAVEGTRVEIVDNNGNPLTSTFSLDVKLKLTFVLLSSSPTLSSSPSPSPTISPTTTPQTLNPKVLLLIYNPIIANQGNQKLVRLKGWNNPDTLTDGFINNVKNASGGLVNYTIAERMEIDGIPVKNDGFQYTKDTYLNCVTSGGSSCHNPDLANYNAMIQSSDACTKRNNGQIDELWIWGGPWFGYYESNLTGPNAFWYNSSPTIGTTCNKLLPIMGFNYERGEAEMFEDLAHRTESTMKKVFGNWAADYNVTSVTVQTDWDKFSILDNQSPGNGGCGNAHTAFNSTQVSGAYDRESLRTVPSHCKDFANFPNLTGVTENLNCNVWGCTSLGYFKNWFFKYLPKAAGVTNGKLNNWWAYLVDPQNTVISGSVQGISTAYAQEAFPTHFRVANTRENLPHVKEQLFNSNPKLIDWQLLEGNGQKTVYAQFKVNNVWSDIYSVSIQLTGQPSSIFEMGLEAGAQYDMSKVDLVVDSKTSWVRLNFIVKSNWSGVDDPNFTSTYNSIIDAYAQKGIKIIGLIGAESVKGGFNRDKPDEFKIKFTDAADKITKAFGNRVKVYELFNEPNDWAGGASSQVSPLTLADYLKSIYQKVKIENNRRDLTLVSGPIFSHDISGGGSGDTGEDYLHQVYSSGISQNGWEDFRATNNTYPLDAIGLHIYVEQGNSDKSRIESAVKRNLDGIKKVIKEFDPNKKIWISELGWGTGTGRVNSQGQADNLEIAFNVLRNDPVVRMGMWFALSDFDDNQYGLINGNGGQKPAFQSFIALASQLRPSPSPSLVVSPSPSPLPSQSPASTPTPTSIVTSSPTPSPLVSPSPVSLPVNTSPTPSPPSEVSKRSDINGDGKVNSVDISLLFQQWRLNTHDNLDKFDLNGDGLINSFDYALMVKDF